MVVYHHGFVVPVDEFLVDVDEPTIPPGSMMDENWHRARQREELRAERRGENPFVDGEELE